MIATTTSRCMRMEQIPISGRSRQLHLIRCKGRLCQWRCDAFVCGRIGSADCPVASENASNLGGAHRPTRPERRC